MSLYRLPDIETSALRLPKAQRAYVRAMHPLVLQMLRASKGSQAIHKARRDAPLPPLAFEGDTTQ